MDFLKEFGKRIKYLRKKAGIKSQEEFAEKLDVHRNNISNIETGKSFVEAKNLIKIKEILNVPYFELFKFEQNISPEGIEALKTKIIGYLDTADEPTLKSLLAILEVQSKNKF